MAKWKVAVVFGGKSGEHEVSLASARSVLAAIDRNRYEVVPLGITKDGRWIAGDRSLNLLTEGVVQATSAKYLASPVEKEPNPLLEVAALTLPDSGARVPVDVVFPVLHGTYGEDGTLQGLLEIAGIPYVGPGVLGSALGMDKAMMKLVFQARGLPVVDFVFFKDVDWQRSRSDLIAEIEERIGYPCFVKPANLGSSVGISKAKSRDDLESAVTLACQFDRKVVVEKGVNAREIECAVLGNDDPLASVVGEIVPGNEFYDYQAKYDSDNTELLIPAPLSDSQVSLVQNLAVRAFKAVDCEGLARVDFFLDRVSEEIYVNEVNTLPGFTDGSMYPKLWESSGLPYKELIDRLIALAIERSEKRKQLRTSFR